MTEALRDLDITKDELNRIGSALKNEEFRKLLVEYCEELSDPASRKQYEEEVTLFEKERGIDVTFIHPKPGYVIKTSAGGNKITFVNVCVNEHVQRPTYKPSMSDITRGVNWSFPHLMSPPREDLNKRGKRCTVYDVIFHPDVLKHTYKNSQLRDVVNNIACETIETNHNVKLDKINLKFPKMLYKGIFRSLVIRKGNCTSTEITTSEHLDKLYSEIYKKIDAPMTASMQSKSKGSKEESSLKKPEYTVPKYVIKHRSNVNIQDFTNSASSHINDAYPKELVVEINLPLLKSSADLELDVSQKTLSLKSEKPTKYKLNLSLPYTVNEDDGLAKFDQDNRKLIITLPIKIKPYPFVGDISNDSGVDSDNPSPMSEYMLPAEEIDLTDNKNTSSTILVKKNNSTEKVYSFLDSETHFTFPEYSCHLFGDILVFTLHVKNVDQNSLDKLFNDMGSAIHMKFSSVSPAFVTLCYAFYVQLPLHVIDSDNVSIEVWDNNVIVQIPFIPTDIPISTYMVGTSVVSLNEKIVEEPVQIFNHFNKTEDSVNKNESNETLVVLVETENQQDISVTINPISDNNTREIEKNYNHIPKDHCYSESSGDELSMSPTKGILKTHRARIPVSRSVSESSIEDYTWSSFENCTLLSDSLIPEESEVSSSMKKTVRFNDVVSQQLFRTNSSILGQKKKNQRKSRNKKRAQERRLSESENSEVEDKKEKGKFIQDRSRSESENSEIDERKKDDKLQRAQENTGDCQLIAEKVEILNIDFKSDLIFDIDL